MHPLVASHLEALGAAYPGTQYWDLVDQSTLIHIPNVPLKRGLWSKTRTSVYFVAPLGFPQARPDCFWADEDLRLAGGMPPTNSGVQAIPNAPPEIGQKLWFSWHLTSWNPNSDTLTTYLEVVKKRFQDPR